MRRIETLPQLWTRQLEQEAGHVRNVLDYTHGNISHAAELLGVPSTTLQYRIAEKYPEQKPRTHKRRGKR